MKNYTSYWTNTHIRQTTVQCYKQMPRSFLLLVKQMSIVSSTAKQMSMSNVKFYYLSNSILDFGNLVCPGRSATQLIKNRNCTHITLGGPIEQKNFDRHKRQKNGCILRLKITLVDFFPLLKKQQNAQCLKQHYAPTILPQKSAFSMQGHLILNNLQVSQAQLDLPSFLQNQVYMLNC